MDIATDAMPDPDDPDGRTVGETSGKAGPITFEDIADEIEERQMSLEGLRERKPSEKGNDSKAVITDGVRVRSIITKSAARDRETLHERRHTSRQRQRMLVVTGKTQLIQRR